MREVNFEASREDTKTINKIAVRAEKLLGKKQIDTMMDITACHLNGKELRLNDLLESDDFNFTHDILGIACHINTNTGNLSNHFRPRFSK